MKVLQADAQEVAVMAMDPHVYLLRSYPLLFGYWLSSSVSEVSEAVEAVATAVPDMNPATTTIQAGAPTAGTQDILTGIQTGKKSGKLKDYETYEGKNQHADAHISKDLQKAFGYHPAGFCLNFSGFSSVLAAFLHLVADEIEDFFD